MDKKALSPLISSLLLIFFAISLGVAVMSWGQSSQAQEKFIAANCQGVGLGTFTVAGENTVCLTEDGLQYTVENMGNQEITGLRFSFLNGDIVQIDIDQNLQVGDIVKDELLAKVSETRKIKIIPQINEGSTTLFCPQAGFAVENVKRC